ncbi:MAG: hypothetical protein KIH01_03715 [Candidatus Freyarchaeota archaeon]|nr:hypothetical protein [Candidatus Jordarchaeia archaeon]
MAKRDYPEKELSALISEFESAMKKCQTAVSSFFEAVSAMSLNSNNSAGEVARSANGALDALYDIYELLFVLEDTAESAAGFTINDDEEKVVWSVVRTVRSVRERVELLQKNVKNYLKAAETPNLAALAREELEKEVKTFNHTMSGLSERGNEFLAMLRSIYEKARAGRLP